MLLYQKRWSVVSIWVILVYITAIFKSVRFCFKNVSDPSGFSFRFQFLCWLRPWHCRFNWRCLVFILGWSFSQSLKLLHGQFTAWSFFSDDSKSIACVHEYFLCFLSNYWVNAKVTIYRRHGRHNALGISISSTSTSLFGSLRRSLRNLQNPEALILSYRRSICMNISVNMNQSKSICVFNLSSFYLA